MANTTERPVSTAVVVKNDQNNAALLVNDDGSINVTTSGGVTADVNLTEVGGQTLPADNDAAGTTVPVPVGGQSNTTLPTYANGDRTQAQYDSRGGQFVVIKGNTQTSAAVVSTPADGTAALNALYVAGFNLLYNGATWDAARETLAANNTQGSGAHAVGMPLWSTSDATALRVNVSASGDTALVAAVSGQTTRVYGLRLNVAGAVVVQIKTGATVVEVFNFAGVGGGVILDLRDRPYYRTAANEALNINLSGEVQVDGVLEYVTSA